MQGRDFSLRHDQIPSSVFRRFYNVVDDDEYDALLKELWITKYWHRGRIGFCRVL